MRKFWPIYLLLVVPFVVLCWVGLYNRATPEIVGIPFFYWFQMLCIPAGALPLLPIYLWEERARRRKDQRRP